MFETTTELQNDELMVVLLLTIIAGFLLIKQLSSKSIYSFCSPLTVMALTVFYYAVSAPVVSIWNNDTIFRGIEHRPYYIISWIGTLLFLVFFLLGYSAVPDRLPKKDKFFSPSIPKLKQFKKQVFICYIIGFCCFMVLAGSSGLSRIAFWKASETVDESLVDVGGFYGYFINGFNFIMVACPGIVYLYKKKQLTLVVTGGGLFVAFGLIVSAGFRWRLVIAALASLHMWYISDRQKVKLVPLAALGFAFLVFMGVMEATRSYGRGLNFAEQKDKSITDYLAAAFNETAVFKASGLIMSRAGKEFDYIGLDPLVQALVTPIPRAFWSSKSTGDYLYHIRESYTSINKNEGVGQAILNYAEYYMMGGWLGVIAMGVAFGWLFGKINKPIINVGSNVELHPWYIIFCLLNAAYVYFIFSRGYVPAQFMIYFFTVYPAWYCFKKSLKNA